MTQPSYVSLRNTTVVLESFWALPRKAYVDFISEAEASIRRQGCISPLPCMAFIVDRTVSNPTRHLRRGSSEKELADYFLDTDLSGAARLYSDFTEAVLWIWGGQTEPKPRPEALKAVDIYDEAVGKDEPFADILGNVYMTLGSRGGQSLLGQFFTPPGISQMLSRMQGMGHTEMNPRALTRIYDPTCGSSALLLASLRVLLQDYGAPVLNRVHVVGVDLDGICARTAAIQIVANVNHHQFDLGAVDIMQGDTLRATTTRMIISATSRRPWQPVGDLVPDQLQEASIV